MSFVSYAQNFEDVMLWRALKHIEKGFYVDVGAQDPIIDSVSKAYYERGWRGIHIEPVPQYADLLRKDRPDETVLQIALADTEGTLGLNVIPNTGLSTFLDSYAQEYQLQGGYERQIIHVPVLTLKSALKSVVGQDVHWLKIDVEGFEERVLRGWDSQVLRPWIMLIEATTPGSPKTDYESWDPILTRAGYKFVYFDGLNRFYISDEHPELAEAFASPPNVFDHVRLSGLANSELCRGLIESHQSRERESMARAEALATELNVARGQNSQLQTHGQWLQNGWEGANQRIEELSEHIGRLKGDFESERQRSGRLEGDLELERQRAGKLERDLESERQHSGKLEGELELECQRTTKIDELSEASHHWWTVADQLNRELQNISASRSWRITAPLRAVNSWRRVLLQHLSPTTRHFGEISSSILRNVGLRAAKYPWLQLRAKQFLQNHPVLHSRLRSFFVGVPLAANGSTAVTRRSGPTSTHQLRHNAQTVRPANRLSPTASLRAMGLWAKRRPSIRQRAERALQKFPTVRERARRFLHSTAGPLPVNTWPNTDVAAPDSRMRIGRLVTSSGEDKFIFYYWIDHTINCSTNTGMQRVVRWLARAMLENGDNLVFVKWDGQGRQLILPTQSDLEQLSLWSGPILRDNDLSKYPLDGTAVVQAEQIIATNGWLLVPEVTHITFHSKAPTLDAISCAKALGLKVAFIFYDAVPLKVEDYEESRDAHAEYMQHIAVADALLPISHFAAGDLTSFYAECHGFTSESMPPIIAVPLPGENYVVPRIHRSEADSSAPIILCVGTIEPRKNQTGLISAFNLLVQRYPELPLRLVLVGNLHPTIAPLLHKAMKENPKIEYLQYVSDHDLWGLYRECAFTVFPSVEEGFGLPVVESLWHGKPCICANFGAMGEIAAGGGCFAVDVRSPGALMEAMERMLVDMELKSRLTTEATSRPIKTWLEYAAEVVNVIDDTTKAKNRPAGIYYWVDQTCRFPINTGVQRLVRMMAKALRGAGARLIPVKWDSSEACFYPPSYDELCYLARWNGPRAEDWDQWKKPSIDAGHWLLVPEVTSLATDLNHVATYAEAHGLKKAAIFYDAIPCKMTTLYPPEFSNGHANYMRSLLRFDKIFSISEFSQNDFEDFVCCDCDRLVNLDDKLLAVPLAGEFPESDRSKLYKEPDSAIIKILCVGRVEPRKNHLALLEAFLIVLNWATRPVELTIVGNSLHTPELEKSVSAYCDSHAEIRWLRSADDSELARIYSECHFSVFPSLEEGFGLPILESLWFARPCICRNSGAMAEVARGGGCLTVDTADVNALAGAIVELVENDALRHQLGEEAAHRTFKTWRQYANEVLQELATKQPNVSRRTEGKGAANFLPNCTQAPGLSICITTYNRASWLAVSLDNLFNRTRTFGDDIEIVVCDNASTDATPDVIKPYLDERNFRYYRNPVNVGMLGNLRVTAHHSRGRYVWILGDDDLVRPGAVDRVLTAVDQHKEVGLVYLNYAYTRISEAEKVRNVDEFLSNAIPIVPAGPDKFGLISEISTLSENFFTAIYCLVFRRDHALHAYSQNTSGRPFSSLLTCIPTSSYVCRDMFQEMGYWIGDPCVVVNMNVSWGRYAPLWILERIPEVYDLAEKMGADPNAVDHWRRHTLDSAIYYLESIFADDPNGNAAYFSMDRWIRRHKHLAEFRAQLPRIMEIYGRAFRSGIRAASESPRDLLERYGLMEIAVND